MRLWEMYMRGQLKKESQALTFGSLYDMMLFEPDNVKDRFYCLDDSDIVATIGGRNPRNTKKYRDWKEEALQATHNADKELVSTEEWKTAEEMIERLKVSGLYDKRFAGGKYQVEFNVDLDGIPLKGFLDCLQDDCIIDSKSSRGISKFKWDVSGWSFDIQAYIYTKVFDIPDFYWVVQEKTFPYFPADVKCSEETLFKGEMKFHEAVENINAWLDGDRQSDKHYAEFIV